MIDDSTMMLSWQCWDLLMMVVVEDDARYRIGIYSDNVMYC